MHIDIVVMPTVICGSIVYYKLKKLQCFLADM